MPGDSITLHPGVIPAIVPRAPADRRGWGARRRRCRSTTGDTFLTRIVRTFLDAGVDDVSSSWDMTRTRSLRSLPQSGLPARFVVNPDYDRGQLSSLVAGLASSIARAWPPRW